MRRRAGFIGYMENCYEVLQGSGGHGRTRTGTGTILSRVSLPIGIHARNPRTVLYMKAYIRASKSTLYAR